MEFVIRVRFHHHTLELVQGDITRQRVDAIVNAANEELAGGGGVDGAIHRAAGPAVMRETTERFPHGCPTGMAVATGAGLLAELGIRWIFHAVGPIWRGGQLDEFEQLRGAYRCCVELAFTHDCASLAFPSLSTGAYRFPVDLAAEQAIGEVRQQLVARSEGPPLLVRFVLFDPGTLAAYARVLESYIE